MQNANQSEREKQTKRIIELLEAVDDRKLQNIYNFVLHIAK